MAKAKALPTLAYEPRNDRQRKVREIWGSEELVVLSLGGPAGTGKTTAALAEAFLDVFAGRRQMVYLARPTVSVEEKLGFFPGTLEDKLGPWLPAFRDVFGRLSDRRLEQLGKYWEPVAVGMLRGRTIANATLIVDEAQNCQYAHLECIVTRPGPKGRIVLCGDAEQSDLQDRRENTPLTLFCEHIRPTHGYEHIEFLDVDQQRHPFVTAVTKELRKYKTGGSVKRPTPARRSS